MGQIFTNIIENCSCGSSNMEQSEDIQQIKTDILNIKGNHLFHLERDVSEIKTDIKLMSQSIMDIKLLLNK